VIRVQYVSTWDEDAAAWGLTLAQRFRFYGRLAEYHGKRNAALLHEADRFGQLVRRCLLLVAALSAIVIALAVLIALP
jgi:hypothetical protein